MTELEIGTNYFDTYTFSTHIDSRDILASVWGTFSRCGSHMPVRV